MNDSKLTKKDIAIIKDCIDISEDFWLERGNDEDRDKFFNQTMPVVDKLNRIKNNIS